MAEPSSSTEAKQVNPYLLPADEQGWRGLSVPGNRKRKWYTVLHNDQVLVTALLLIPGERSVSHSHETGELSIHYYGELNPVVSWNPPGMVHPSYQGSAQGATPLQRMIDEAAALSTGNAALGHLLQGILDEQLQLRERLDELLKPKPTPFIIIDVLFPPFRTTISDPDLPGETKTVTGQWYD